MAIYLYEHQVGHDGQLVGFPGLGGCMGIVLHTSTGLFGYHCPPGNEDKARSFGEFCRKHAHFGNVVGLYGSCRFPVRWDRDGDVQWKQEMKYIATFIGYRGPVFGFDMTAPGTGITASVQDNAYLEYKLRPGEAAPYVKMAVMSDMNETRGLVAHGATGIRTIKPKSKLGYELAMPYSATPGSSRITTGMAKKPGRQKHTATGTAGFKYFYIA